MSTLKRCCGYKGYWACADEHPDHILPVDKFGVDKGSKDGLHHWCRKCSTYSANIRNELKPHHPVTGQWKHNWKNKYARSLGGKADTYGWQSLLDKAEVKWNEEIKGHLLDTAPIDKVLKVMSEPKPLRTVTTTVKPRNYSLVTSLKELYNYTCQVLGCNEQEVDLAHLYPHRYDDSVDNETNAAVLCKNHHWSLDHKRMYIEDDLTFTRYNLDGKLIEESIIVCHKDHKIDAKFITKSQNWFLGWEQSNDRKEQAMG